MVRVLGFTPSRMAEALVGRLAAIAGPALTVVTHGMVAAIAQGDTRPGGGMLLRRRAASHPAQSLRGLPSVDRRLRVACQAGPFLPVDPAAARLPPEALESALPAWAPSIIASLGRDRRWQWAVSLHWTAEAVVRARRSQLIGPKPLDEAVAAALAAERAARSGALRAVLGPEVFGAIDHGGGPVSVTLTVVLPAETELGPLLATLPAWARAGATTHLDGPLPPIAFDPPRIIADGNGFHLVGGPAMADAAADQGRALAEAPARSGRRRGDGAASPTLQILGSAQRT